MPASQYLALRWLSSPLTHHPALDLKERNGVNHPQRANASRPLRRALRLSGSLLPPPGMLPCGILSLSLEEGQLAPMVEKEGLLHFFCKHRWKPKRPLRKPSLDKEREDAPERGSLHAPCCTATTHPGTLPGWGLACCGGLPISCWINALEKPVMCNQLHLCVCVCSHRWVWASRNTQEAQMKGNPMQLLAQSKPYLVLVSPVSSSRAVTSIALRAKLDMVNRNHSRDCELGKLF